MCWRYLFPRYLFLLVFLLISCACNLEKERFIIDFEVKEFTYAFGRQVPPLLPLQNNTRPIDLTLSIKAEGGIDYPSTRVINEEVRWYENNIEVAMTQHFVSAYILDDFEILTIALHSECPGIYSPTSLSITINGSHWLESFQKTKTYFWLPDFLPPASDIRGNGADI
jgi:hypothetical protein